MARVKGNFIEQRIRKCFQRILDHGTYKESDLVDMENLYREGMQHVRESIKYALDIKEE